MKKLLRKDSMVTIALSLVVTVAFIQMYLGPSRKQAAKVRAATAQVMATIGNVPSMVAQLEMLKKEVERRTEFLSARERVMPRDGDQHSVVRRVADLASESRLKVTRIEPLAAIPHECFDELPFRVTFSGDYVKAAGFLRALEREPRMILIQELLIAESGAKAGGDVSIDVKFAVYSGRKNFFDFSEKGESSPAIPADTRIDGPSAEERPETARTPRRAAVERNLN